MHTFLICFVSAKVANHVFGTIEKFSEVFPLVKVHTKSAVAMNAGKGFEQIAGNNKDWIEMGDIKIC